jgi:hypothetical protein
MEEVRAFGEAVPLFGGAALEMKGKVELGVVEVETRLGDMMKEEVDKYSLEILVVDRGENKLGCDVSSNSFDRIVVPQGSD